MREEHLPEENLNSTCLGPVLARGLMPVSAPDELWRQMRNPQVVRRRTSYLTPVALLAAVSVAAAVVWGFLPRRTLSPQALAIQALERGQENMELQSGAIPEIRAWVKTRTGLDLPLPSESSPMVRVSGVCAVKGGMPTIEVAYRVSGHNAALLVSKADPAMSRDGKHRFLKCETNGGTRVSSWIMRGQLYTLAYAAPGDLRDECMLCHNAAVSMTALN